MPFVKTKKKRQRQKRLVPREFMIPVGADLTKSTGQCADSWSDSQLAEARMILPVKYHAISLEWLRKEWTNIRKQTTPGYRLNGKGPAKGSRKKTKRKPVPPWYAEYLMSDHWKFFRKEVLVFWGHSCCICDNSIEEAILDVHHRKYDRCPYNEKVTDVVVMCRACHERHEEHMQDIPKEKNHRQEQLF